MSRLATWLECEQKIPLARTNPDKRFGAESSDKGMAQEDDGSKKSHPRKRTTRFDDYETSIRKRRNVSDTDSTRRFNDRRFNVDLLIINYTAWS